MVSVPVLSELIAEVKPGVSTDGSSLTIALRLARSTPPRERIIWVTVGSASGTAAMARVPALTKGTSQASPRESRGDGGAGRGHRADEEHVPGLAAGAPEHEHHDHREAGRSGDPEGEPVQ